MQYPCEATFWVFTLYDNKELFYRKERREKSLAYFAKCFAHFASKSYVITYLRILLGTILSDYDGQKWSYCPARNLGSISSFAHENLGSNCSAFSKV